MPKPLDQPIVVVAAQMADQLEIASYTVDAQAKLVVDIVLRPSRMNPDGVTRTYLPNFAKSLDAATTQAAMADGTVRLVVAALQATGVDPAVIGRVQAAFAANPDLPWQLYYAATRDAIYARV
jgi:hypothetical protein